MLGHEWCNNIILSPVESSLNCASLSLHADYSQRFPGTVADESDFTNTTQAVLHTSVGIERLFTTHLYFSLLIFSILVAFSHSASTNWTVLKTLVCQLFLLRLSFSECDSTVCVFFCLRMVFSKVTSKGIIYKQFKSLQIKKAIDVIFRYIK